MAPPKVPAIHHASQPTMSLVLFLKNQPTTDRKTLKTNCVPSEHMEFFSCHDFINNVYSGLYIVSNLYRFRGCRDVYRYMKICLCVFTCVLTCTHMHKQMHKSPEEEVSCLTLKPLPYFFKRGSLYESGSRMVSKIQYSYLILPQS